MNENVINILQIGSNNWKFTETIPDNINWYFLEQKELPLFIDFLNDDNIGEWFQFSENEEVNFNGVLLTDKNYSLELLKLENLIQPYTIFYDMYLEPSEQRIRELLYRKKYHPIDMQNKKDVLKIFSKCLFNGQHGMKYHVENFQVPTDLHTRTYFQGHHYLKVDSLYGYEFRPIASIRLNYPYNREYCLEFWWELSYEDTSEIMVVIKLIEQGSTSNILNKWLIRKEELNKPYIIDYANSGYLAVSLFAKGYGSIKIGPAHFRRSRLGLGQYILGGERYADESGQEFMAYFEPGDLKPPLNVYFSGYRSAEGFEGYFMMKRMGTPFLLICDPRLEGGAFYIGSPEFEKTIQRVIEEKLKLLGFTNSQLILSGLSMGTYGAMYYASKLIPHAIIVGKPLINLGTMAENLHLKRPNEFATSLDLLLLKEGSLSKKSVDKLNQYFWNSFKQADFSKTLLAIAYMKNDDYDSQAYSDLLKYKSSKKPKIIGKGWIGRHNDNSSAITNWFLNQYNSILKKDFQRGDED